MRLEVPVDHPEFGKLQICSCRNKQVSQQILERLFSMSNLRELRELTFESFQPRGHIGMPPRLADSLELAYNHARQYAQQMNGWLLLQGSYGCGKTHLAAAIANFAVGMGVPTLFITVPDLLDALRFTYEDQDVSFESRFEEIRTSPLLILDDFGTQNATPWAQEKLFQILNYRYINHLPLVITTNLMMNQIEGRIRSRLQDPELVSRAHILAPDYRNPADDAGSSPLSSLNELRRYTFGTFEARKDEGISSDELQSLDKAARAARSFAENPRGWLVFIGPSGSGKTHLAAAIANYRTELGFANIFVVVPDLLDHLRSTFNPNSAITLYKLFEDVRTTPLLILDDLGTQSSTPWAREKLYQLVNHRYNAELPTVFTTINKVEEIDERLRSRMMDVRLCKIYALTVPSYTGSTSQKAKTPVKRTRAKHI